MHTRWVDEEIANLAAAESSDDSRRWIESPETPVASAGGSQQASPLTGTAPVMVDTSDPLALFDYDRQVKEAQSVDETPEEEAISLVGPDGSVGIPAPIQGTIIQISVEEGDQILIGQELLVMEAMKMEHVIKADKSGMIKKINVAPGDIIVEGHPLIFVEESDSGDATFVEEETIDLDYIRPDLEEAYARHAYTLDENRPEAVAKRYGRG